MRTNIKTIKIISAVLLTVGLLLGFLTGKVYAAGSSDYNRYNVVIVLDASNSMNYTDPDGLRFDAIEQFTGLLAENGNVLGSIVFSDTIVASQNLIAADGTEAKTQVTDMLKSVAATGHTNIGQALLTAVSMIETDGNPDLPSVIVFLSDGNTEMPTAEITEVSLGQKADAIWQAREDKIAIYSVCLNANKSADIAEMQQISEATGGIFREVATAEHLKDVFNTFYSLIYETSTIILVDEVFPDGGTIETTFEVPGIGVEEVNIVINGAAISVNLLKPDGTQYDASTYAADTFTLIKLTEVTPGKWTLITEGAPGDQIKINMVYNTNLEIALTARPEGSVINPDDTLTVQATLKSGDKAATSSDQYVGYSAMLQILDAYGEQIDSVPMKVSGSCFEGDYKFQEGTYFYQVYVDGYYLEKTSEKAGPLNVLAKTISEEEKNPDDPVSNEENTAPEVVVTTQNPGIILLIAIGILAVIGIIIMGILRYITLTKPFRGTISVQSYCNGSYRGISRTPKRGRCKLSVFGLDNVGLNYSKCYFQATKQPFVYLITNVPVLWNGQKTNKIRVQSGTEVTISVNEGDPRLLYVRFDSRMSKRRRGSRPGRS